MSRFAQAGQSMVEYLVIAAIVLLIIAVPYESKSSVLVFLLDAVHIAWSKWFGALSIPQ